MKTKVAVACVLLAVAALVLGCEETTFVKKDLGGGGREADVGEALGPPSAVGEGTGRPSIHVEISPAEGNVEPPVIDSGQSKDYVIKAGDQLEISVYGEKEDMLRNVIIRPDGKLSYVYVDEMVAAGKTIKELKKALTERLSEYFREPEVSVILTAPTGNVATILGEVSSPGRYAIKNDTRLIDLIAMAGGIRYGSAGTSSGVATQETADLERAYVVRNNRVLNVRFEKILDSQRRPTLEDLKENNVTILPEDRIYIPSVISQDNKVFVVGRGVGSNMVIRYAKNISFLEALAEAGGTSKASWERKAYIVRGRFQEPKVIAVNAAHIMEGKEKDFNLDRGDIVVVPIHPFEQIQDVIGYASTILSFANTINSTFTTYKGHPIKRPE